MTTSRSNGARKGVRKGPDRLGLSDLREDLAAVGHDVTTLKNDAIGLATERVTQAAKSAKDSAEAALDAGKRAVSGASHDVSSWISRKPMTAVMIAVGVGAILSRLMARRHR